MGGSSRRHICASVVRDRTTTPKKKMKGVVIVYTRSIGSKRRIISRRSGEFIVFRSRLLFKKRILCHPPRKEGKKMEENGRKMNDGKKIEMRFIRGKEHAKPKTKNQKPKSRD